MARVSMGFVKHQITKIGATELTGFFAATVHSEGRGAFGYLMPAILVGQSGFGAQARGGAPPTMVMHDAV